MRFVVPLMAALATVPAVAADRQPVRPGAVVVSYDDLDLSRDAGRATLGRRVHAAARAACASSPDPACVSKAAARAYLNIDLRRAAGHTGA